MRYGEAAIRALRNSPLLHALKGDDTSFELWSYAGNLVNTYRRLEDAHEESYSSDSVILEIKNGKVVKAHEIRGER